MVPGVVVVAAHHPLIRPHRTIQARHDVVDGHHVPIEGHGQAHLGRPRPDPIGDGQAAAPLGGSDFAFNGIEQGLGVGIGDGQRGNRPHCGRFVSGEALCPGDRRPTGREQIARVQCEIHDGAALHAAVGLVAADGIDLALHVAVVGGVGIHDAADGAVLRCHLWLQAPENAAIANDGDLALQAHAVAGEELVILAGAVVDVHELGSHVAIGREGVVGGQEVCRGAALVALDAALL